MLILETASTEVRLCLFDVNKNKQPLLNTHATASEFGSLTAPVSPFRSNGHHQADPHAPLLFLTHLRPFSPPRPGISSDFPKNFPPSAPVLDIPPYYSYPGAWSDVAGRAE